MFLARYLCAVFLSAVSLAVDAGEKIILPSDPATWNGDFSRVAQSTAKCAGGDIEQLGRRMVLSQPYSPSEFEAFHRGGLPFSGLSDSDRFYSFYSRSASPGGRFWAFGGFVVVRGACIIHAEVTTYDN
ncbi:hypothetical protein [Lysobacter tyrosinilyticus]